MSHLSLLDRYRKLVTKTKYEQSQPKNSEVIEAAIELSEKIRKKYPSV